MSLVLLFAAVSALTPVRDPFWPVGYEGARQYISLEPRVMRAARTSEAQGAESEDSDVPEKQDASAEVSQEMQSRWNDALKTLRFEGGIRSRSADGLSSKGTMMVNGRFRSVGDVVWTDHDGYRFAWRLAQQGAEGKVKLIRIKAASLEELKGKN